MFGSLKKNDSAEAPFLLQSPVPGITCDWVKVVVPRVYTEEFGDAARRARTEQVGLWAACDRPFEE